MILKMFSKLTNQGMLHEIHSCWMVVCVSVMKSIQTEKKSAEKNWKFYDKTIILEWIYKASCLWLEPKK